MRRVIVGISGASGAIYGIRLLQLTQDLPDVETHLVLTGAARRTVDAETPFSASEVEKMADVAYRPGDIAASISSGSYDVCAMVVVPCSIKSLSGIANCYADNLLQRAADVTLKERRPLILAVRETPLHIGHLRLMQQAAEMGAVIMPPVPALYHCPTTLDAIVDQTVLRILDQIGIRRDLPQFPRWSGLATSRHHRNGDTCLVSHGNH